MNVKQQIHQIMAVDLGEGSLYAAQFVGVVFHSFPGEGAIS
jgi:hypothetical protein